MGLVLLDPMEHLDIAGKPFVAVGNHQLVFLLLAL